MHVSTETKHHSHICHIDGVGLTSTAPKVVDSLCQLQTDWASTSDIAEIAHEDRHPVWRSLNRLEKAGVVKSREADVETYGSARKPIQWSITSRSREAGVIGRLRQDVDKPLDPVEEREKRIEELESQVSALQAQINKIENRIDPSQAYAAWDGIDPSI